MDYVIIAVAILGLAIVEIFLLYFMLSRYVKPQKVGMLIRCLWTLFIISVILYLIFFSPDAIRGYFEAANSYGFWISILTGAIFSLIIWLTIFSRNKSK